MECDCLERFTKEFRERTDDEKAEIESGFLLQGNVLNSYVVIPVYFRKKKQDGSLKVKREKSVIFPSFCPFCGQRTKLKSDENSKNQS